MSDIEIAGEYEQTEKDDCAIKLYFAQDGESIWDIAKRYRAPINSVIEENDLNGDIISENGMLIIPMA